MATDSNSSTPQSQPIMEKVAHLPFKPGVYMFKDEGNSVLYVGKAKQLRNRVRSYFQDSSTHDGRIRAMVRRIEDVEVFITDTEGEALILENNLIKKHQPRYNIMYRDDKSYPYICVTNEERPRVYPTRTVIRDGSRYFGPYDHVGHMRRMLDTIRETFGLCTCACSSKTVDRMKNAPKWGSCFDDYLGSCSAEMDLEDYKEIIEQVVRMLNGKTDHLIRDLKDEMKMASEQLAFEQAARIRDRVKSLQKYNNKMKIVASKEVDRDLFALEVDRELGMACGVLFKIREGKLVGKFHRYLKNIKGLTEGEMLQSFVEDYYTGQFAGAIPDEVYVSRELVDDEPLLQYLWEQHGRKVPIKEPKIGEKAQMVRMAESNARLQLGEKRLEKEKAERDRIPQSLKDLKKELHLDRMPRRIECFDNSNLQGSDPVASMVCFVDAQPRKSEYKRFNIKSVEGPDDFASMKEIVKRRYSRVVKEGRQIPDLIVVDGGKGQLTSAIEALQEIDFYGQVPVVGLAKRLEEIFIPGKADPVMIPKTSPSLKLMQRIRDEAHRFAITFHRNKRSGRTVKTELEEIEGIGPKTARKLLNIFGSVKHIREQPLDKLQEAVGESTGLSVFEHYKTAENSESTRAKSDGF